jgi:ubiquinone/menaquinone biosynthesis C-methylase UbiE
VKHRTKWTRSSRFLRYHATVTYLSPLGYLLGLQGAALLRGFADGFADEEFVTSRIAEIRVLLDNPALADRGVTATPGAIDAAEVYRNWADSYDRPGNRLLEIEAPIIREVLAGLPVGTALDAACGTGRHAGYLAELGHRVIGLDQSPEMLAKARARLPEIPLVRSNLDRIPLADNTVDTVLCALALTHVAELAPVLAEFARVLRPGGHLVISDAHPLLSYVRPTLPRRPGPDGRPSVLTEYHRPLSEYLTAALPLGFQVRQCAEPTRPPLCFGFAPPSLPTHQSWDLVYWCQDAAAAVHNGSPVLVIWDFQLVG